MTLIENFNSIYRTVCGNRSYSTNNAIASGSYLGITDSRSSAQAIRQHTYNGVFYGCMYVNINTMTTDEFMPFYTSESFATGVKTIGIRCRPVSGNVILEIAEGTFDPSGHPFPTHLYSANQVPIPTGHCHIAWYFNANSGVQSTSTMWLNLVETPLTAFPTITPVSTLMPTSVIMSPYTPVGYKLGMLWAGFDNTVDRTIFERSMINWCGVSPMFMGRHGEYPLGGLRAKSYINCSESTIKDMAVEGYYSQVGTVPYQYNNEIITVKNMPGYFGFDLGNEHV